MPNFTCDWTALSTPLRHVWEHTLGSGHAPLGLRADWQAQLRRCRADLGVRHVRFHGILDDDMGTLLCENNAYLYSFFNADQIIDFLLEIGVRPFVELSFMPSTLASGDKTVFHYAARVSPPTDYDQWATLIGKLVGHWVARYGVDEVRRWFFEVWNEPNLTAFGTGQQADYFRLYRATVRAVKEVDADLRVGGPVTAMAAWIPDFLDYCEKEHLPVDFVDTHYYPTDAFGQIGADTETQLAHAPRHVMRDQAQQTHDQARGLPVYYTEWNGSSNPRDPLHDAPYAAAFAVKTLLEVEPLVECYSYWTFSDIFEENYFPSVPFQGGFGLLNIQGLPKPVYRAYQLLHRLGTERLPVDGHHATVDAWVIRRGGGLTVLLTNHAFPRHAIATEQVQVTIRHAPRPVAASIERVDDDHANAPALWHALGAPTYPSRAHLAQLEEAAALVAQPTPCVYGDDGALRLTTTLPPHGVAAITVEWADGGGAGE